jgi:hypothetical protein
LGPRRLKRLPGPPIYNDMAEQWDPPSGESKGPGGPGLNRNALQATLADLVREADGPANAPGGPAASAVAGSGRPVVPGAPVPAPSAGPRPLRGPSAGRPVVDTDELEPEAAPTPGAPVPRPQASGRPRLPFGPEHAPAPPATGAAGTVRPGSGLPGGFGVGGGVGGGLGGGVGVGVGGGIGPGTLGAGSLSGRITPGDLGDNLARLTPTPTEQPTIPLRKRREAEAANNERPERPAQPAAAAPPQARPAVAIEAWSPRFDDILPQRPARSGRGFRRAR